MEDIQDKIKKIPTQVNRWHAFALWAPPVFLIVGSSLLFSNLINFGTAFLFGVALLSMTTFGWWVWIIYSIAKLGTFLIKTHTEINTAISELYEIRRIVNEEMKNVKK